MHVDKNLGAGRDVFASKTGRGIVDKLTAKALAEKPAPGQYDP